MATADRPQIAALAPWFGGKRTMGPAIAAELGPHDQYFSLFCGSLADLLAKEPCTFETVNDLHGDIINLARVLQDPSKGPRLLRRLRRLLFHESFLEEARDRILALPDPPDVVDEERAFWFFVFSWMGRNGEAGLDPVVRSSRICVRWTPNGGSPAVRFANAIDSIPAWRRRIRRVTILRRDAFDVVATIPDRPGTVIYCDPPYVEKSETYLHDFAPGLGHDFTPGLFQDSCGACSLPAAEHADDHERLRDALARFQETRVVVSYYDCPRIRELYRGWTFVDHARAKHLSVQGRHKAKPSKAPELLIINGPSYAQ